ncbi:hypothetical protein ABZV24_30250 [Streptomyces sp. NPDC005251]|uniref:hypothetical protein n=1 Tax=Streptomyces sp. NPDC005251 TaxID=3157166 RepID=UPI0033A3D363
MAEYEGVDALLAAITDDALPEGARYDVLFMAEHQSAVADLDVLREQLVIIGDTLAGSGKAAEPARASQKSKKSKKLRRFEKSGNQQQAQGARAASGGGRPGGVPMKRSWHPGALAVGTLAATAVATLVVGMGWLVAQGGGGADATSSADSKAHRPGESSLSAPGYIACSRLIAEGKVTEVLPVPGTTQNRITVDVYHYYKPAKGEKEVTFLLDKDIAPRPHRGDEALVGIQQHATTPDVWTTGEKNIARDRSWIVKALPESQGMKCGQ